MHYLDEGSGAPVVFVHGSPSWSFEFRHLVAKLRDRFRCVAPDHLGFGLSARSDRPEDYHPASHAGNFAFPRHIVGASDWLSTIWNDREAFAGKPALLLWGFRDIAFRRKELEVWKSALHACDVHEFPDCGHFLAEEAPDEIAALMRTFMSDGERLAS